MLIPIALTVLTVTTLQQTSPSSTTPAAQAPQTQTAPAQAPPAAERSDRAVNPSQPDFTIIALPTTLRMPKFASAFRVTHRFTRSLGGGSFGDLASDFFGLDSAAQIGLEYRFGIMAGTQVGIHRTNDRTIELFAQHQVLRQRGRMPLGLDALAAFEGANNLHEHHSPSIGAIVSREFGVHGAAYVEPIYVNNTNPLPKALVDHNSTFMVGIGGRARLLSKLYLVGEIIPRVAGYEPGSNQASVGLEGRAGGHSFQVNFSNGWGTTLGQIARGGVDNHSWYLGFNISRKFF